MKERLATLVTIFALIGGTGGAVAFAGSDHGGNGNGAAHGQYCEGHQKEHGRHHQKHEDCGQGDDNHGHDKGKNHGHDKGKNYGGGKGSGYWGDSHTSSKSHK